MKKKNKFRDPLYREKASGWLHVVGAVVTLIGIFVLNYHSAKKDNLPLYYSTSVFMGTMLMVYIASAVYHIIPHDKEWKQVFRRIDQAVIYGLIAGTYTPLYVITLRNHGGMKLLAVIWAIAIIGAILKLLKLNLSSNLQTAIYIGMGSIWLYNSSDLLEVLGPDGYWWFKAGVKAYVIGAFCYFLEEKYDPTNKGWLHESFHVMVMLGCFFHYWLMLVYL